MWDMTPPKGPANVFVKPRRKDGKYLCSVGFLRGRLIRCLRTAEQIRADFGDPDQYRIIGPKEFTV